MGNDKVSNTGHIVRSSTGEKLVADCNKANDYLQDVRARFTSSWPLEAMFEELGFSRTRAKLIEAILRKVGVLATKKNGSTKIKVRSNPLSSETVKAVLSPSQRARYFGTDESSITFKQPEAVWEREKGDESTEGQVIDESAELVNTSSEMTSDSPQSEKSESVLDHFREGKDPFEGHRTPRIPVKEWLGAAKETQVPPKVLSEGLQRQLARHLKGLRAQIERLKGELAQKDAYIAELEMKCAARPTIDPELAEVLKELDM